MKRYLLTATLALFAIACSSDEGGDKASGFSKAVDFSNPSSVVTAIFQAAKNGDSSQLAGLCDPQGEGDGDTKRLCAVKKESSDWGSFVEVFKDGKIVGSPKIDGNSAKVDFKFGPGGSRDETMNLVNRGGKWYLSSF